MKLLGKNSVGEEENKFEDARLVCPEGNEDGRGARRMGEKKERKGRILY